MKMNKKTALSILLGSFLTIILISSFGFTQKKNKHTNHQVSNVKTLQTSQNIAQHVNFSQGNVGNYPDFTFSAEESIHAVVHIRTEYIRKPSMYDFFYNHRDFFERGNPRSNAVVASGSGVIISDDGYIVTNNHVVEGAEKITVTLNDKRTYTASIIGTDPSTDLALIKIEEEDLPFLIYGDSDQVKIGEWVLAVGNPFNLTSTVTAGIVSAKARDINILGNAFGGGNAIESFIQTDAAVNKGNSGGALVNTKGQLIGINAAIASGTGYYAGYSFAIPVNIAKKVVDDLLQYGKVQRGYIGVQIRELDAQLAEEEGIEDMNGVYVAGLSDNGSAKKAGIQEGDIIISIEGKPVNTTSELIGLVGQYRPGDFINVNVKRNNKQKTFRLELTDAYGNTELVKEEKNAEEHFLGTTFASVNNDLLQKLNLDNGVQVIDIQKNSKLSGSGIKERFIITRIDKKMVSKPADIKAILQGKKGGVLVEGVYPNGITAYYGFGL